MPLVETAKSSVSTAMEKHSADAKADKLLTRLIEAEDPETGSQLDFLGVCSEAFAFL